MIIKTAYSNTYYARRMHVDYKKLLIFLAFLMVFLLPDNAYAQETQVYDELEIFINIKGVGTGDFPGIISGEQLFLSIADLFDFLKIKNQVSSGMDSISGFFVNPQNTYLVDKVHNCLTFNDKVYNLNEGDLIKSETNLYLRDVYFGEVFGLDCKFNFRSLSATIVSKLELPVIREMKQKEMRQNISRIKGEFIADTVIKRSYPLFHFGMADWAVFATEREGGQDQASVNLNLGSVVAGGELTTTLNYNSLDPFTEEQQYYRWRYVDNNQRALRQVVAGKITTQATSSVHNYVVGLQATNTPTTFNRSFGSYTLSDKTEPGWIVELYVNNVLIDYVQADASGFFTFEVPLVYGSSVVRLKFYGPWGEENSKEENITIPFNFLREKTFEYTASAGMVEDDDNSLFARASMGYGLSRNLTLGTGIEYLSSVTSGPAMPYFSASYRLKSNVLLNGEYTYGVRSKATLSYRLPSSIQLELNYIHYDKNQTAITTANKEERKLSLSLPIKIKKITALNRISVNQMVLPFYKYTTCEWMLSFPVYNVNTNITSYALFVGKNDPSIYSNMYLSVRLPRRFVVMPQAQYSVTKNQVISAKLMLEKRFTNLAFLNLSYEKNFRNDYNAAELGLRFDFDFARTGASVRRSKGEFSTVQYARGSIINDKKTKYLGADNINNVGKGGITVIAFLDINANGKRDSGEQKIGGLNLHASSGNTIRCEKDTTIIVRGLEPYTTCYLELDNYSFDNISWQIKNKTYAVEVDPNNLKLIEIPVSIFGEASGMVNLEENGEQRGLGRIMINFFTKEMKPVGKALTESDGYFSYLGFRPGQYIASIDTLQLKKLKFTVTPYEQSFTIKQDAEGDIIDGLDFTLFRVLPDTTAVKDTSAVIAGDTIRFIVPDTAATVRQTVKTDTTVMIIHEVTKEVVSSSTDEFTIQIGAFRRKSNAEALKKRLSAVLDKKVEIITEDGFYKVRVTGFESKEDLNNYIPVLKKYGVTEMWIVNTTVKKQDVVIKTVQDTIATVVSVTETELIPGVRKELGIQLGAFKEKRWATQLRNKTKGLTDKELEMIFEDGFYKVRIKGLTDLKEMESLMPMLFENGYKDVWILPFNERIEVPSNPAMLRHVFKTELAPLANAVPTVALQVGAFYKKHDAIKAQKKIAKGTGRNVVMKKQWDYYTLFVTGFYTKESTYKYYPEIAGLGYPDIYLVQNYYDY